MLFILFVNIQLCKLRCKHVKVELKVSLELNTVENNSAQQAKHTLPQGQICLLNVYSQICESKDIQICMMIAELAHFDILI